MVDLLFKLGRAVSEKQRQLFGVALAMKRGKIPITDTPAGEIAKNLSEKKIEEFARKPIKGE